VELWLARAARTHGDRLALLGAGGRQLSYEALYAQARAAAGALLEQGVSAGDRVALALAGEDLVVALHGCMAIGAVAVPIDLRLGADQRQARMAGAGTVASAPLAGAVTVASAPLAGAGTVASAPLAGALAPVGRELVLDEIATIMHTSGTTAAPRPVALSYDNWLWNALGSALALGLDPHERWLCPMPLGHVGGLSIQLRSAIYATTVVLHDRFDTEAALAALMDPAQGVTLVSLVPTMLSRLLQAGLRDPPTLRWALLGGGPIAPALLQAAAAAGVMVAPSYGMTEACSQIATNGLPLLGIELRIADDGEILVRGANVARGALGDDGWLHTGDLGALDGRGRLTVTGRKADTIVSGGENVAPAEVEAVLLEHPAVADAAVFGIPDPEWGEAVVASVVLRAGMDADGEALRAHCAATLAGFKAPKTIRLVSSLPRGETGKLRRRDLI
jgi:O-succinylbenzoic acid--CoA ligase